MRIMTLLFGVLFSASALATVHPLDIVILADDTNKTLIIRTTAPAENSTTVELVTTGGEITYRKQLQSGNFLNFRCDLSSLPRGGYDLIFSDSRGRTIQPFYHTRKGIVANAKLASRYILPEVNLQDRSLVLAHLNELSKRLRVTITTPQGQDVFSETIPAGTQPTRAYALNQLPKGEYTLTMAAADFGNHRQTFELR